MQSDVPSGIDWPLSYTKLCNAKINPGDILTYDIMVSDVELI